MKFVNTRYFSEAGNYYLKNKVYTHALPGTLEFRAFWNEEIRRSKQGYTVGDITITGDHYFYLNYSPIRRVVYDKTGKATKAVSKSVSLPDFWDGDYEFFWSKEIARHGISLEDYTKLGLYSRIKDLSGGKHLICGKSRRKGFSFKNASIVLKEYLLNRGSKSLIASFEEKYAKDTFKKAQEYSDHLNTIALKSPFAKKKLINSANDLQMKSGFKRPIGGIVVEQGYLSEITGVTFQNNPDAARGKDPNLVIFEEAGTFANLKDAFRAVEPSLKDGDYVTGQAIIFGCVCKGTKVWTHDGKQINIEDLKQENGIIGYAGKGIIREPIIWMKPPAKKPCYRIITEKGKMIECSNDHPLLSSKNNFIKNKRKVVTFKKAEDLSIGDQLMYVRQIPIFGNKRIWNPRLVGLLIGDGNYTLNATPQLSVEGEDIYEWLKSTNEEITIYKEFKTTKGLNYRSIGIKNSINKLKELGIYGQVWDKKHLPYNIYEADQYSIQELIGGYFDADGSVNYNKKKKSLKITLTSKYIHLLQEVKTLLYKLNIGCSIVQEYRKDGYKEGIIYRLYINKLKDIIEFKKHIKFISKHKQEVLDNFDLNYNGRYSYDNCLFELGSNTDKGTYYLQEDNNKLDNLESCYIKSIEYIGEQEVYNLNAGITHTYITNGFVSGNTGGDMEYGTLDFNEMFYNPEPYDMLAFDNIWDEEQNNNTCGFFFPVHLNKVGYIDSDGNSDMEAAVKSEMIKREMIKTKSKDKQQLTKYITEQPFTPKEAFSISSTNIFNVYELDLHLRNLEAKATVDNIGIKGKLTITDLGKVDFIKDDTLYECGFPVRDQDKHEGAVVIYEFPPEDGIIPELMYIGSLDPYAKDQAEYSNSLGACYIYKRGSIEGGLTDRLVASYIGRPETLKQFHETVRRLLIFFKAKCMYENQINLFKEYLDTKNCLYLLAETPTWLKASKKYSATSYGVSMNKDTKMQLETSLAEWLLEPNVEGVPNYKFIYDKALLKELISYNDEGNFDRVIALMLIILYKVQLTKIAVQKKKEIAQDSFLTRKLFINERR